MRALIAPSTGVAVVVGERFYLLDLDGGVRACTMQDVRMTLDGTGGLETVEVQTFEELRDRLRTAWRVHRCMKLIHIAADPGETSELRASSAELVEKNLSDPAVADSVSRHLDASGSNLAQLRSELRVVGGSDTDDAPSPPGSAGPHILWVEEDELLRAPQIEMLSNMGITVVMCSSGEAALEVLDRGSFQVLVVDQHLIDMSDEELASRAVAMAPQMRIVRLASYGRSSVLEAVILSARGSPRRA